MKVIAARKLEYVEKKPVWQRIQRSLAKELGWEIVKSRWININKDDDVNPNFRSRAVGNEFNNSGIEGLCAAAPPLEALRLILSWAATSDVARQGYAMGSKEDKSMLIAEVSRAFF